MTSIYFITQDCLANQADTEQMKGLLKEAKFDISENVEESDVIIFNTCSVKNPEESTFFKNLQETKSKYPYKIIIIAGCIAQADPEKFKKYPLIGSKQFHKVVEVVEESLNDNIVKMLETGEMPPLNLPSIRKNPIVEIVPISRGCLGACTFCKTKSAQGDLISYPLKDILQRVQKAVNEGVKEIWLTSQDTGCYGLDFKTCLPELLDKLVKIPGPFKIKVGMMNPDSLSKIKDGLIESFKQEKIFKYLHLPIQSGNNEILKNMNRNYIVEDFKEQIKSFREVFPNINLTTDIIVGFPGETEEQYWDTLNLIRELTPNLVNISRFWARPKTPAAEMEQLSEEIIKHRSKILTDIFQNISQIQNERWLGWEGLIMIDECGLNHQHIGKNKYYKQIMIEGDFKLGEIVKIKIVRAERFLLKAEVIN